MCIAGQYEMRAESERANKHSIEIDGRKVNMGSCCGQVIQHVLSLQYTECLL